MTADEELEVAMAAYRAEEAAITNPVVVKKIANGVPPLVAYREYRGF
ncbi:hypothetical protein LCM28_09955 [Salipiger pacificus]|nr:hypothetical protein [Alloyangia pacifica]